MKDTNLQILEVELTSNRITQKKIMPRHIVINLLKTKDKEKKTLKAARSKTVPHPQGITILMIADFSPKNHEAKRKWHNIVLSVQRKTVNPECYILQEARRYEDSLRKEN